MATIILFFGGFIYWSMKKTESAPVIVHQIVTPAKMSASALPVMSIDRVEEKTPDTVVITKQILSLLPEGELLDLTITSVDDSYIEEEPEVEEEEILTTRDIAVAKVQAKIDRILLIPTEHIPDDIDKFRKELYLMGQRIKEDYPIAMSDIELLIAFRKVVFLECKNKTGCAAINGGCNWKANGGSNARGAIQIMPKFRERHGISEYDHELPLYQQIPNIEYFIRHKLKNQWVEIRPEGADNSDNRLDPTKITHWIHVYALVFSPMNANKDIDTPFYRDCTRYNRSKPCRYNSKGRKVKCSYHGNSGYDIDNTGYITLRNIMDYADKRHFSVF